MITPAFVRYMARYNQWQNRAVYASAARLAEPERQREAGAFFGSIERTLNHLLWADRMWMHRFDGWLRPVGGVRDRQCGSWDELATARADCDSAILAWADAIDAARLNADLTWRSATAHLEKTMPLALLVSHMFNHQTHHRGQVHCLLTQCGVDPGVTDMPMLPVDLPPR